MNLIKANDYTNKNLEFVSASTLQEYPFSELGIFIETLNWQGKGTFQISVNRTFDLNNNGPAMIILDFSYTGDKPDNPGIQIAGKFNSKPFESIISRSMIISDVNGNTVQEIAIPFKSDGRIFSNNLAFDISFKNDYSNNNKGTLTIKNSSHLLIGDVLVIDTYGRFPTQIFPSILLGESSIGGTTAFTYIQLTVNNQTLIDKGKYQLLLEFSYEGNVDVSLALITANYDLFSFTKNESIANIITATTDFPVEQGANYFLIELVIYSDNLWNTDFKISITDCYIILKEGSRIFGFGDIEIPFFQWPKTPIVGIVVLALWIVPYSILKFRKRKKLPGEVEINLLEDDNEMSILDPEGLSAESDDIEESYDFEEEI